MSLYNPPVLHLGQVNQTFNTADFENTNVNVSLTQSAGDARYLKLAGGTVQGPVICQQAITAPSISLSTNTNTQTLGQIGYTSSQQRVITGGSVVNGTGLSSPGFCSLPLAGGVYLVEFYWYIYGTDIITLTFAQFGLSTSSTSFNDVYTQDNSFVTEVIPSGSTKYMNRSYIYRASSTTTICNQIQIAWSTASTNPTITIQYGITATRIA